MNYELFYKGVAASLIYSIVGIAVLLLAYWVIERLTPEKSWEEIVQNKNMALAIVFAAFILDIYNYSCSNTWVREIICPYFFYWQCLSLRLVV
ncbi:Predicted membrane protein [Sphingobacterium multivorum]|uniref:Predicted membrane protein n=1 Tax=Sphingobacterium multivorum TaxID=28454 RepID=A0A2X2IYB5_SPHMU|nr:DUF350 domain-containing protein [Sphingobacterium multivorum]SPZ85171.1 Predicted membrane protein [Sphingobacterium multivorum]